MPKRIKQRWPDANEVAYQLVQSLTEQDRPKKEPSTSEISRVMAALGRKGGKVGGKRRLETMTQDQRTDAAKRAAQARWRKEKG
jgi:hypothetical protein